MRTVLTSGIMVGMVRLMGIVGDAQSGMRGGGGACSPMIMPGPCRGTLGQGINVGIAGGIEH